MVGVLVDLVVIFTDLEVFLNFFIKDIMNEVLLIFLTSFLPKFWKLNSKIIPGSRFGMARVELCLIKQLSSGSLGSCYASDTSPSLRTLESDSGLWRSIWSWLPG